MGIRTDLAMEAKALWEKSAGKTTKLAGVRARERERDGFAVTDVHILDRRGEAALGKPAGRYVTLELPPLARDVRPAAEALAAELRTPMRPLALDLTRLESVETLRVLMREEEPEVAVLVNAAWFGKFGTCADLTLQETCDMIDLNCRAAAALTAAVLPYMGRGSRVLEICSSAAFQPLPGFNVYAATKAFLLRYSRALRWEAAPRGIRVTAVCPGWIRTDFMDVARDTKNGRTVRSFPFAQRPETVARRALRNSRLLAVTTCGLPALVQRVASKFLPHCFIMACWEGLRRA